MGDWWALFKSSWHRSLRLLWIMIIAVQWLAYTEPFWLRDTTASVLITLTAAVVIEILIPVRVVYRIIIEAAAVVFIVYRVIRYYGHYIPVSDPLVTMRERLIDTGIQLSPFIWFALGAWILLLLSSWLVSTKARILMFIAMNIAALAALDSFTSAVLWQEVAWIVFAGMGWLVTQHLRTFQQRYPRGWSYLLDYPLKVTVNVAIIFSLIIITGVNMPEVKPSLTDPYTAWREWRGTEGSSGSSTVKEGTGAGTGTKVSGGTTSGYSLDDDNLGGGFAFDYTPVMTVTSDLRTYMRGETRSNYSGSGWTDNNRVNRGPLERAEVGQPLDGSNSKVPTQTLQQTVKMLGNNDYPAVFGAYSISKVENIDGEQRSRGLFWRARDSELLWDTESRDLAYPQSYVITSEIPVIPVQELSTKTYEELYNNGTDIGREFLQLPDRFPARVRELAQEITAGAQTPYEKTALLQQYLQQTFPYTNTPDVSKRRSTDFVESFLFEVKEGYCDYYSTALVTMARSLNIPARWVKGYAPGEQAELPDNIAMQQGRVVNNNYTITNADAHSWAEVYFGEYGWVPVEATPGFNVPLLTEEETDPAADPQEEEEETAQPEETPAGTDDAQNGFDVFSWAVPAAAAVLLAWAGYLFWQHRYSIRFLIQRMKRGRPLSPAEKVAVETGRWVRYLKRKGFTKEEHETLRESVENWSRKRPLVTGNLSILLAMFEKSQYSPNVIEDKDWYKVYTEALRLRKSMKSGK
jgi:transglutaminase-like putative cysteine protease